MRKCFIVISILTIVACAIASCTGRESGEEESAYLFVYFAGNDSTEESVHFAVSTGSPNFYALNNTNPVLDSKQISSSGGIRDPHITRGPDGKTFYMTATDMVSANGWANRAMVLLKSTDLINWTSTVIDIPTRFPGNDDLISVRAPQSMYHSEAGKMMIYWSMRHKHIGTDIIYYAYANDDFTDLETEPKPLFIPSDSLSCLGPEIVKKDDTYHLFYKTEEHGNGIRMATTKDLTSGKWIEDPDDKQLTDRDVEGPCVFKILGEDRYILMYDLYWAGRYQFTQSYDLHKFEPIPEEVTMDFAPRHGTIIPITSNELNRLFEKWGKPRELEQTTVNPVIPGFHSDPSLFYSFETQKYYIFATSDGRRRKNSVQVRAYSSDDLKTWKDEGIMIDVSSDQVPWASQYIGGPVMCSVQSKQDPSEYDYYLYFNANNNKTEQTAIGVAHAKHPTGPFTVSDSCIIAKSPTNDGMQMGFSIFNDPLSDKVYGYWGRNYLAVAELNPDMMSINDSTMRTITPGKVTADSLSYKSDPFVIYRNAT
ncbi:MAG: family 43 glycosylhydrolase, partial [Muribaculaceae bacterium]|nr:family 43 glycosylhydrolase [Muribaculaceae bacterium]